jgi:hypothetical protein
MTLSAPGLTLLNVKTPPDWPRACWPDTSCHLESKAPVFRQECSRFWNQVQWGAEENEARRGPSLWQPPINSNPDLTAVTLA